MALPAFQPEPSYRYQSDWAENPQSAGWWKRHFSAPFSYEQRPSSVGQTEFAPFAKGMAFGPVSAMSYRLIQERWDKWVEENYPELFIFDDGADQPFEGVGKVGYLNDNFSKQADMYIAESAARWGVPANFLKAIIAHESSGNEADVNRYVYLPSRGHYILPYIGFTDPATRSFGVDPRSLVGNMAGQIDLLARALREFYDKPGIGDTYGWQGVAAYHYSGDPSGAFTPGDSYQYGTTQQYVNNVMTWWRQMDASVNQNTINWRPDRPAGPGGFQMGSPTSPVWQRVNQWDETVMQAAQRYNVPPNLIKAIMRLESGGDPNARSPQGATGLMQIMPMWNGTQGLNINNPRENIFLGAYILSENYRQYGSWEMAAKAYLGLEGTDALGTDANTYWTRVNQYWAELDAASSGLFGGPGRHQGPMLQAEAIWGGVPYEISQRHGSTEFARQYPHWYEYSYDVMGYLSHPGHDIAIPRGTRLYSPVAGTVIVVGSASYRDDYGGAGEIRIRLDNGHELILGHTATAAVRVGQRVNPGDFVGTSGTAGTGDHLHLEYRIPNPSFNGGWQAIDPFEALGGQYTGSFGPAASSTPGIARPMTYMDLMKQAAMGREILPGQAMSSGSGWHDWIRRAMFGQSTSWDLRRPSGTAWTPRAVSGYAHQGNIYRTPYSGPLE